MIRLRKVGHVYGLRTPWESRALRGIDLDVAARERLLVVGDNGSGKTTLAWILAGLLRPTEGTAAINSTSLDAASGATAIGFQHARLQLFRPTVRQDIRHGTSLDGDGVDESLRLVGLEPERFRDRRVDELSGGEERRVALAGLLVRRPKLLVLDEPLAGLDPPSRRSLAAILGGLSERENVATVVVSHDLDDADAFADRIVVLDAGRIVSDARMGAELQ